MGYDHVARLEPTVPLRPTAGAAGTRFVVAETLIRFDHVLGSQRSCTRRSTPRRAGLAARPLRAASAADALRLPMQDEYEADVRRAKEAIADGGHSRRPPQRAERPTGRAPSTPIARCGGQSSPYLFCLELDGIALV
jgi:hypothetical protein